MVSPTNLPQRPHERRTTYASRPAEAMTCSSVILYRAGIHPKKVSGRTGSWMLGSSRRLRAAYSVFHLGRSIYSRLV